MIAQGSLSLVHLAQVNVASMLAPLDSPVMAGFVAQLDAGNALADQSSGFIWRLKTEEGNATCVQAFPDPAVLVNISVWESVEALRAFTYKSIHAGPLRQRAEWFSKAREAYFALWWIPVGHIPTLDEARDRLELRRKHGDTPEAFSFAKSFPPPLPGSESAVEIAA